MSENMKSKVVVNNNVANLTEEETKQYLTPFAFKIDNTLFGLPLASPTKRGVALFIDFILIALLSDMSGVFLAFAIAISLFYLGSNRRAQQQGKIKGRKRRAIMRFFAALILFVVLVNTLPPLLKYTGINERPEAPETSEKFGEFTKSIALTATLFASVQTVNDSDCQVLSCWQDEVNKIAKNIADISFEGEFELTEVEVNDIFIEISQAIDIQTEEQKSLADSMNKVYLKHLIKRQQEVPNEAIPTALENSSQNTTLKKSQAALINNNEKESNTLILEEVITPPKKGTSSIEEPKKPVYSLIEWAKGIIHDLGLGFGWATFYFTVLTSLWHGQTLGKKLLGIKVLQLDGTPLSLWESFGRYGGYGAGLATGLLGFIQIYWNPNKQAIHDQISATVVIDVNKARFNKNAKA